VDLVINATSERDQVLVELRAGQTLVDLSVSGDGDRPRSASGRRRGVDGLGVLVAQGAAAFELWTGVSAPFDVMRARP
jgi:shikimate 5-dehydrogenase